MRYSLLALGVSLVVSLPVRGETGGTADVWSFERCLDHVLAQDLGLKEAEARLRQAHLGLQDAKKVFFPSTSVTAGVYAGNLEDEAGHVQPYLGIRISPILEGYDKFFSGRLADLQIQLSQLEADELRTLLVSRLRETYLRLVALSGAEALLREAAAHQERLIGVAAADADPELADLRQLEASAAAHRERMGLRELISRRAEEELQMKTLLGLPPDASFAVDPATPPSSVLPVEDENASTPASRVALDLELARQRLSAARFERYPQPQLRMGLNKGGLDIRSGAYVFVGVEVPLFDWGRRARRRAQLTYEITERTHQMTRAAQARQAELARLGLKREALEQRGRDLTEQVDLVARRLRLQVSLYETGRTSASELLRTRAELARVKAEQVLDQAGLWAVLCQRDALLKIGGTSAAP